MIISGNTSRPQIPLLPVMFAGLFIVGISIEKKLHWICELHGLNQIRVSGRLTNMFTAPLIGGAIFFVALVTATGILQTVSGADLSH